MTGTVTASDTSVIAVQRVIHRDPRSANPFVDFMPMMSLQSEVFLVSLIHTFTLETARTNERLSIHRYAEADRNLRAAACGDLLELYGGVRMSRTSLSGQCDGSEGVNWATSSKVIAMKRSTINDRGHVRCARSMSSLLKNGA